MQMSVILQTLKHGVVLGVTSYAPVDLAKNISIATANWPNYAKK